MIRAFCDSCAAPISNEDDHMEIAEIFVVDKKQAMQAKLLHFCGGKTCICKWLDKLANRPLLVTPQGAGQALFGGPNG